VTLFRKFGLVDAVFVMYPASKKYADHFTFRFRQRIIKWKPFLIGCIKHPNKKISLMFAISATEADIHEPSNADSVREMHIRTSEVCLQLGATSTHFAGTLPSALNRLRVRRPNNEQTATQENVVKAVHLIRQSCGGASDDPVIILGSKGYVGRTVLKVLQEQGLSVYGVDVGDTFPSVSRGVVLNISRPEAINNLIESIAPGMVVLNEVYPEPHAEVVRLFAEKGVPVHHIVGVKAAAVPPFPGAYLGGAPCCSALPGVNYEVLIKRL
jgi:hypothetical protein